MGISPSSYIQVPLPSPLGDNIVSIDDYAKDDGPEAVRPLCTGCLKKNVNEVNQA